MSKKYVYKPIDLVELENNYDLYAIIDSSKNVEFLRNSEELKNFLKGCEEDDDELYIYALQSVVRPNEVAGSDDEEDDDENPETDSQEIDTNKIIEDFTQAFNNSLKAIVSKIK